MTDMFFALNGNFARALSGWDFDEEPVNALVTFASPALIADVRRSGMPFSRVMLDSGAFSAWNSGNVIDIDALIEATLDPFFTESVCLDVIGDAEASVRNAMAMKAAGSPAFPVFHLGDPWEHLDAYRAAFPRVGLSCRFGEPITQSLAWLEQCFARGWPHRFHSFGWTGAAALSRFPFDSADSLSWVVPQQFGQWRAFGRQHRAHFGFPSPATGLAVRRVPAESLRGEIMAFLKVQRFLKWKWRKELATCRTTTS